MILDIVDTVWILIGAHIAVVALGLVAGFSPTLYTIQLAVTSKSKHPKPYVFGLSAGVATAFITLLVLFQFFQPRTLVSFIDSTVTVLFVNTGFNIVIGCILLAAGGWYLTRKTQIQRKHRSHKKTGTIGLAGIAYVNAITSISSISTAFIATNIMESTVGGITTTLILAALFLAAAVFPFIFILYLLERYPKKLRAIVQRIKRITNRIAFRPLLGGTLALLGTVVIVLAVIGVMH